MTKRMHHLLLCIAVVVAAMGVVAASASADYGTYENANQIDIPDQGRASDYPSTIDVQGLPGRITDVTVALRGLSHTRPADLDILLVSPDGDDSFVMSDACGTGFENYSFYFTKNAASSMPSGPSSSCDQVVYRPTAYEPGETLPFVAGNTHVADFDEFAGGHPNGTWRLYVHDDNYGDSGTIRLGWSLGIQTAVPDAVVPGNTTTGAADPYPVTQSVSGLRGVSSDLNVSLNGVYHRQVDDLQLVLLGPRGQKVKLMGNACYGSRALSTDWTWDDEAAVPMPHFGGCPTGVYKPTTYDPSLPAPAPGPAGPYLNSMARFDGSDPNGDWRLYAYDDYPGAGDGFFVKRFTLGITMRPKARTAFTESAVSVAEGKARELTLHRSANGQTLGPGSVTVMSSPGTATSGTDYKPVSTKIDFQRGQTEAKISVAALADAIREGPETFTLKLVSPSGDVNPQGPWPVVTIQNV
jgi:subtilisin-like proprotein convertase family protein